MAPTPHLVGLFPDVNVAVVGDLILDEYVAGACDRVSPEAPVPVVRVHATQAVLGGAANTAANVTSLGGRCTLVGLVGEDWAGHQLRALAASKRIVLEAVTDGRPTTRKVRIVGERQQLARLDYEHDAPAREAATQALTDRISRAVAASQAVVVSDYAKGAITPALCSCVFTAARQARVPVIVDPRPQHRQFYAGCDVMTPNWKEAQSLVGEPEYEATDARIDEIGRRLVARYGASAVITLGARGIRVFPRGGGSAFGIAAAAREVFDVSGAGDTVVATLALSLGAGASLRDGVEVANHAAGVVVGKLGTATVTPDELLSGRDGGRCVSREDLPGLSMALRASGKRIVSINGSFDVLHSGHLHILEEARRQGDVLVVGLNSDASVRAYKGPSRPVVTQGDRASLLLGLRCVDYVHVFDETDPIAFLEAVRPDVHVNCAEYGDDCIEAPTVRKHGGRLHLVERVGGVSTSGLLTRMAQLGGGAGDR